MVCEEYGEGVSCMGALRNRRSWNCEGKLEGTEGRIL